MTVQFPPETAKPISALRVLVLEDQAFQRNLVTGLLKAAGVSLITEAADGNEGLQALGRAEQGFDIAICDLKMEGMDGVEFIRHATRLKVGGFILISALEQQIFSYVADLMRGFGASLIGVLPKPVKLECLKQLLSDYQQSDAHGGRHLRDAFRAAWTKTDLLAALSRDEFIPYFQPKFDLVTGRPIGVEILARWNHPEKGVLPPSDFIETMENEGLIDHLTESVFHQSLAYAKQWNRRGWNIGLAVNISPLTLQNIETPKYVHSLVKQFGILPQQITVEVTETAVSKNSTGLLETLTRLRMQGFEIAVDDFGTGYSSLLQLSELPFTEIKIDRQFVNGATGNKKSAVILESIVDLSGKLGIRAVAEGIESKQELDFIRSLGCTLGQGFYLATPMPINALVAYLGSVGRNEAAVVDDGR
jgi:EAL domain-containing protein (putative c-di-GMP-specific phosphodiesterase class I)/FixJ family two-component response regulator